METVVACKSLTKTFGSNIAVNQINFQVKKGEIFGLLGSDGAGKTTTLRMLCGLITATSGSADVLGLDVASQSEAVKEHIGYMSQKFSLYGDLTVEENIDFTADLYQTPLSERIERTDYLLETARLTPFKKRLAANLSGGMKQKLALACALIHTPEALFLDEPTTGVDPVSRRDFWDILYGLMNEGLTLIVSTPYMDEAERCDRVAMMSRGNFILCDTPQKLKKQMSSTVVEIFGADLNLIKKALRNLSYIESVDIYGDRLHAITTKEKTDIEIIQHLIQNQINYQSVRRVEPSLEDVFVKHMRQNDFLNGGEVNNV